jgi:hypothetical protein
MYKYIYTYIGGGSNILRVNLTTAKDLGSGISLYFQFAKSAAICFLFMSIFSVPSILFSYTGSKIPVNDRDVFGLYKFTIGNLFICLYSCMYISSCICVYACVCTSIYAHILYGV